MGLEFAGALVSAWGVWLMTRRHPLGWPVGLVSVALYGGIFTEAKLYSDALLQGAFAILIIYGWQRWLRHLGADGRVQIARLSWQAGSRHVLWGVLGALVLGWFMHRYTDASLPWLDAALTSFSLVAQWWQAKRHVANWWLWIVVDTVYLGEYFYKELYITTFLYAGFLWLAWLGLRHWRAEWQRETATSIQTPSSSSAD